MAPERVIRDSDDEDLEEEIPTSADPLQPSPSFPIVDGVAPEHKEAPDDPHAEPLIEDASLKVTSGHDLSVNFDDFLQSQSQGRQACISPLQSMRKLDGDAEKAHGNGQDYGMLLKFSFSVLYLSASYR
jgi:hypothetical protein